MNRVPFGGLRAVVSRLGFVVLFLCSAALGSAASVDRSTAVSSRNHSVERNDFKPSHGLMMNQVRFLTDGVRTVEIPAGSLLNLPENGRIRIAEKLTGELVDWTDFFETNFDVIRQVGVTRAQLRAEAQIHPSVSAHLVQSKMVGIAIAAGRPVALPQPS